MNREPLLAAAIRDWIATHPTVRVPLREILGAAAAVDRTAAASVGWRTRIMAALTDLTESGDIRLPTTSWDRTALPALPSFVTRAVEPNDPPPSRERAVWHAELSWAAQLCDADVLTATEYRQLTDINAWLRRRTGTVIPMRERSLEIFGDEKVLDTVVLGRLFSPGRLTWELLQAFPCWPPVEQVVLGNAAWLIVENYTTYYSIARRARETDFDGRIIWGSGNQVATRLSALTGAPKPLRCWYFGDIDAGGFRVARSASRRAQLLGLPALEPARGLYRLALRHGNARVDKANSPNEDALIWIRDWVGGQLGRDLAESVRGRSRIVQEYVGRVLLAETSVVQWF
ncbi:Wadjet anti-phage system protein JetD domain-containing protein [Nocardia arthritidis]|uniref:Wadjet anti-phage system protein JetD domain-containing protein n=1 Tax=Nocardia arthritidis TaxID=228602 RepID=UPI00142D3CB8|nr:Wadjet anti-phage system protein JetD domain-containing protein [Nocardia arthritidis]